MRFMQKHRSSRMDKKSQKGLIKIEGDRLKQPELEIDRLIDKGEIDANYWYLQSFTKYLDTNLQNRVAQDFYGKFRFTFSDSIAKFLFLEGRPGTRLCSPRNSPWQSAIAEANCFYINHLGNNYRLSYSIIVYKQYISLARAREKCLYVQQ